MDSLALATTVVNLLIPYLSKAAESLADKAADAAWKQLESLYTTVKKKLSANTYAEETLIRVTDAPQSEARQAALVGVLEEEIKDDSEFAEALQKLLSEVKGSDADNIVQKVTIGGHARTGDVNTIGKVEGSVDLSRRK